MLLARSARAKRQGLEVGAVCAEKGLRAFAYSLSFHMRSGGDGGHGRLVGRWCRAPPHASPRPSAARRRRSAAPSAGCSLRRGSLPSVPSPGLSLTLQGKAPPPPPVGVRATGEGGGASRRAGGGGDPERAPPSRHPAHRLAQKFHFKFAGSL